MTIDVPQSNQRGIETASCDASSGHGSVPQSNQRGIETKQLDPRLGQEGRASIEPAWD